MRNKRLLVVAILMLAVGFAAISTTLLINGTAGISTDALNFQNDILFTAATPYSTQYGNITFNISADGKKITFTTGKLSKIGMASTLNFTITNYNTQYGTNVNIVCGPKLANSSATTDQQTANSNLFNEYVTMTYGYASNAKTGSINPSGTLNGTVTAEAKKTYFDEAGLNIEIECEIVGTATEQTATSAALPRS